jgi:RNA polymerase sigma-70 factor (ECF subfamily)
MVQRLRSSVLVAEPFGDRFASSDAARTTGATKTVASGATEAQVFALVYRQMRALAGRRDVDELAQVAAEHAIRSLPSFEGRSQLSTWTFRICYLTVQKHDRWYRRWLRRFTLTVDGELPDFAAELAHGDEVVARRERAARLASALDRLSPKRRAVVLLHDVEGLSIEEIAGVVGAASAAVRSRLRDGRKALAASLAKDTYFGDEACRRKRGHDALR